MSNEIRVLATPSQTLYFHLENAADQAWYIVGAAWETWGGGAGRDKDDYDYSLTDLGGGLYTADFPAAITTAGRYTVVVAEQAGGSPADSDSIVGGGSIYWNGSAEVDLEASTVGSGAYTVTLTVKTTGGTAIPGVEVWLNTSNDSSGSVVVPKTTNSSGQVSWLLDYTTYYIFCDLAGYTFNSASMTPASGSVTFSKSIGTAAATTSDDNYTESFLTRAIAEVRNNIDEPSYNAKYSDAKIIQKLEQAYPLVLGEINRNSTTPVVVKYEVTITATGTEYVLPVGKSSILCMYTSSDAGYKVFYDSRSRQNPLGRSIWVEGNTLKLQSEGFLPAGEVVTVEYSPAGVARFHNGTCTVDSAGDTVVLGSTPHAGTLDTHQNAYVGSILRILKVDGSTVTGNSLQERMINSYTQSSRSAELDVALSPVPTTDDGNIYYEIAPAIYKGLDEVLALYVAHLIAGIEGNNNRSNAMKVLYRDQLRNLRLTAYYSNLNEANRIHGDTYRNSRYRSSRRRGGAR